MADRYDVIVIGGGAAGMMAAGRAAERGKKTLLIERNARIGEKLRITGGGRCNILNAESDEKKLLAKYGSGEQFLYSSFAKFGMADGRSFFESRGLPIKVEANNRAFPASEKAGDVVHILESYMQEGAVEVFTKTRVSNVEVAEGSIRRITAGKREFAADSYIFATGGLSHPETGSTGDGFAWLLASGHTIAPPTPTLVPLKVREKWVRDVSGVTIADVRVGFYVNGKKRLSRTGNILLTHFGISGPTVLNAAGVVADLLHEGAVEARLDLFRDTDLGHLDRRITEVFDRNKNKLLKNVFKEIAPAGMSAALLALVPSVDPERKVHSVRREERRALAGMLKNLTLTVDSLMGFDRAVVADGGLPLSEVDTRTMRSKKVRNLYVTGDLLNIRRPSGGYSLQLCWTTGYLAGNSV